MISTLSQAVRRMGSHLLHVPILNVVVDLLSDADRGLSLVLLIFKPSPLLRVSNHLRLVRLWYVI